MDHWFDTYLPGEDLPNNLPWSPFNVDLASEHIMRAGLVSHHWQETLGWMHVADLLPISIFCVAIERRYAERDRDHRVP